MKQKDFTQLFLEHPSFEGLLANFRNKKEKQALKGLHGSVVPIHIFNFFKQVNKTQLIIVNDREQATYLQNDLDALNGEPLSLLFPASYKKSYEYTLVDNANIVDRTEVLNSVGNDRSIPRIIVSYPEALVEKVINQKSLVKNTFGIKVGDELDFDFITELLITYGFEKSDFVYEAGDFSIRGGIVDIFSFSNDMPFRIELFGNDVESIRTFDPESQLSLEDKQHISIIPDVQTKLQEESRESFFDFLSKDTVVWLKDYQYCKEIYQRSFEKITEDFERIKESAGVKSLITEPEVLFDNEKIFKASLDKMYTIEFGTSSFLTKETLDFNTQVQPSFNKQFNLLLDNLSEHRFNGYTIIVSTESIQQANKLQDIILDHDPDLTHHFLNTPLSAGFVDNDLKILVYTDHQIFDRFHRVKEKERYSKSKALTLKELKNLHPGDYVTHIDYGIGRFAGMDRQRMGENEQEVVRIIFKDDDVLYVSVHNLHKISRYSSKDGAAPRMSKLGSPEWNNKKKKVKSRVRQLAFDLISLYAKRKEAKGFAFDKDSFLQVELETSFLYEDTPDQGKATEEVKRDMEKYSPMDRLVCGDVGFGKTEVAIRAAFKAVQDNKQVAVLVPTTILALQHYNSFKSRLRDFPCKVDFINRFRTAKEVKEIQNNLKEGKIDILIGTHKIVGKDVVFKDLGLLIIDEEQKFGVATKEKLKNLSYTVDVLTLTATPIPRTLQFSLMGARDLSIINTPPPNRRPVTTEVLTFDDEVIRDAVSSELKRNGQVFFVHNRIASLDELGNKIMKLVPDARVAIAHGQMEGKQLERTMLRFIEHEYDVLISTNIIESGLDIPNANTIIINQSNMYGLSDLHQMRGRVGRSNKKAYCYLLVNSLATLTSDARKRLTTLEEFSDLGDGFKVAMKDLDIRGAGDLLGAEQSGFINDIGLEAYQQILEETVQELKETEFKELFEGEIDFEKLKKTDCNIETDLPLYIPEHYVENISERLRLYNELDSTKTEEALQEFIKGIKDRFGNLPEEVNHLTETVRLRWLAESLGFERLSIKNDHMKAYVTTTNNDKYFQSEKFGKILAHIQTNGKTCSLNEVKSQMVLNFKKIETVEKAKIKLESILTT